MGFYLHREGPDLGKTSCPLPPSSRLDAHFGTPYPRSANFDTDIGAFIESSSVSSPIGLMASWVITHNLRIDSELAEQMDPMELSSLNELLDRIAALGVAIGYDQIGLKNRPKGD